MAKSQWPALLWNSHDSPEETKARLDAWTRGSKEVLHQWITEKRYRIGYLEQIYAPAEYLDGFAKERFGSDSQNKRFETIPVSAMKSIS